MAHTSSIDELNNLQTEQDKQKIRDYFEEMELEPEEIEKRINTANGINNLYLMLFLLMSATVAVGDSVIDDNNYWTDYLIRGYNDVLTENGYNVEDPMISQRVDETITEVLNTTYEHIAQDYYLSHDRAVMIASNDTNAFANYEQHVEAIKAGYTRKRWLAMRDKKVRHTHVWADGQEVDVQKPFIVGGYEMLFPLDQSLGADAKEVVNCRCVCQYFDKKDVSTNGLRNENPLTSEQVIECTRYARELGFDEDIEYSESINTGIVNYRNQGSLLVIGTDIYPNPNGTTANSLIGYKGALAHEIIGHYGAFKAGKTQSVSYLEEAQASLRASILTKGLSDKDKELLKRDAIDRLRPYGLKLNDIKKDLYLE